MSYLPKVISIRYDSLHPPGAAWDPSRNAFLVTSMRLGTVSVVYPDGTVHELVKDEDLIATVGIRVDTVRGRMVFVHADAGYAERSSKRTTFRVTGVGIYDLGTGERIHLVQLGDDRHGANLVNDVCLSADGTAYCTDTPNDGIFRIGTDGTVTRLRSGALAARPPNIGIMGIAWHPGGFLLTVRHDNGALYRVPADDPGAMTEVALDRRLVGGAALALRPDGSLAAVTNTLIGPGKDTVCTLRSGDGWRSAVTERVEPWPDAAPTAATVTPSGTYVMSGRPDRLVGGSGTWDEFTLRRL